METTMKVINLDEIRSKQYESNIERYGVDGCIICGRPLSERDMENRKFIHMLPNGDITDSQELDGKIPENHDLGWWQEAKSEIPMGKQLTKIDFFSYQCLRNIYKQRRNHRLKEWHTFVDWIKTLPYAKELIYEI